MKQIVTIIVREPDTDTALQLRYLLADTIESRKLGQVVNEGIGEGYTEVSFITDYNEKATEIKSLVHSLGLSGSSEIEVETV